MRFLLYAASAPLPCFAGVSVSFAQKKPLRIMGMGNLSGFVAVKGLTLFFSLPIMRSSSGGVAEWLMAADCKSALSEYAGSNPAPTTRLLLRGVKCLSCCEASSCGCSSMVEQKPSKLMTRVRFPSPAQKKLRRCSSGVEHSLGKGEAMGSIPIIGSIFFCLIFQKF